MEVPQLGSSKTETDSSVDNQRKQDVLKASIKATWTVLKDVLTPLSLKDNKTLMTATYLTNKGTTVPRRLDQLLKDHFVAGGSTIRTIVFARSLLQKSHDLLSCGIRPSVFSDSFNKAATKSVEILANMDVPLVLFQWLVKTVATSFTSDVVSECSTQLPLLAVDAVLSVVDPANPYVFDVSDIKIVKKLGKTMHKMNKMSIEHVKALVLDNRAYGGPIRLENAKIAVIQFQILPPVTETEQLNYHSQMDSILTEKRSYILEMIRTIKATGCNVLLIEKSMLRDNVNNQIKKAIHRMTKKCYTEANILVIKDIERDEIEFFTKTLSCSPIRNIEQFHAEKLGYVDLVEVDTLQYGKIVKVTGIQNMRKTTTLLLKGPNQSEINDVERSLHEAFSFVRCLVASRFLIAGGGVLEIELSRKLGAWANALPEKEEQYCVQAFAEALDVIPRTLAEIAGLNPIQIITGLRNPHVQGEITNNSYGQITKILEDNVANLRLLSQTAVRIATECTRMILEIDDIDLIEG